MRTVFPPCSAPATERKYETPIHTTPVHAQSPYDDLGELPESYGSGRLFLAARDPHWLFCYWDYTWQQMEDIRRMARYSELKLRVLEGASSGVVEEITLNPSSKNWFFKVDRADAEYTAAFGYYDHSGNFTVTARSGLARTPPDGPSTNTEVRFVTIPYRVPFHKLFEMLKKHFRNSDELADVLYRLQMEGFPFPFDYPRPKHREANLNRELGQYFDRELVRRIQAGSEILTEWMQRRFREDISSPSSPFGASFGGSPPTRGFWFKVNTELIVYGATDPSARVRVDGREIALRHDGTFRFQFALPDGIYRLPASATSPDGTETREITLHFERKTGKKGEVGEVKTPFGLEPPPRSC